MNIKKILEKEILDPGIISILINPYYFIKKNLISGLRRNARFIHGNVLDFGCGDRGYEHLFKTETIIGLDIRKSGHDHSAENIDIFYDGETLPFRDNSFDSIISIEVFEHIFNPEQILDELYRILKPGGYMLISIPFIWEEHEQPFDYGRYTSFGIKHLLKTHGFSIETLEKSSKFIETVFQMWNLFIYKKLFPKSRVLQTLIIPLLVFPTNLIGSLFTLLLPKNSDLFLNMIIVAEKARGGND